MADYAKKKNDELAALCKERGLPHTGKKAELVKRLEDHDAQAGNNNAKTDNASSTQVEQAKEDAQPTTTESTDSKTAAVSKPQDTTAADPNAAGVSVEQSENNSAEFTLGLQERTLDEEIAKRKKRAEKFGIDISQDETLKLLERAKRFGTDNVPGLLNKALPERAERSNKRGREDKDDRKRSRQRGNDDRPPKEQQESNPDGFPTWMTAKDREAAERRKAKFTTTE